MQQQRNAMSQLKSIFISLPLFGLILCAALVGCRNEPEPRESSAAAAPQPQGPPETPAPAQPQGPPETPAAAEASAPDAGDATALPAATELQNDDAADETEAPVDAAFAKEFQRVLALERACRFAPAIRRCRELRQTYRTGREAESLRRKLEQLQEFSDTASELSLAFAIDKLSSKNPHMYRSAARKQLVEAGEVGRLFLRRAIRTRRNDGIANEAAEILVDAAGRRAVPFLVAQLAPPPEEPLLGTLIQGLVRHAQTVSLPELLALVKLRSTPAAADHREALTEVLKRLAEAEFEADQLEPCYRQTVNDAEFAQRHVVELLALLYDRSTDRDDQRFNELLGGDGRLAELRNYAERAAAAADDALAAWGEEMERGLSRIDFAALRRGLTAWWGFDQVKDRSVADVNGDHPATLVGRRKPKLFEGVSGKCLRFKTTRNSYVESQPTKGRVFRHLHRRSYAFSAWIKPDGRPDRKQPDPWWGIVMKPGWHLGLRLNADGRVGFTHYHAREQGTSVNSKEPVATGDWSHVVGSVDHRDKIVRVFVNGELAGEKELPANGSYWDRHDNEPVRVGAARTDRGDWRCRFNGWIDEVAVYRRALSEEDAGHLHRIRTPKSRRNLTRPDP